MVDFSSNSLLMLTVVLKEFVLRWIQKKQDYLRAEIYSGLKDTVLRGDTTRASIGKRIVLPSSFTGGPRYMIQNYRCDWFGLF